MLHRQAGQCFCTRRNAARSNGGVARQAFRGYAGRWAH
nr:MAG TPA: hypothetical protein [Caudoviricetes sp.]